NGGTLLIQCYLGIGNTSLSVHSPAWEEYDGARETRRTYTSFSNRSIYERNHECFRSGYRVLRQPIVWGTIQSVLVLAWKTATTNCPFEGGLVARIFGVVQMRHLEAT